MLLGHGVNELAFAGPDFEAERLCFFEIGVKVAWLDLDQFGVLGDKLFGPGFVS
ncbi:hypothetical protein FD09_GL001493 [Schleiferilactobacillus perolens DSM 12744]|uniref:Uncharacterized protein n=1 Tax=Schleiferilactobacillus perolens DSM 12744 TaxID=1423792 RepID=A0A0R1N7N9_9LACO|nr:hypothetical protein FD09_GL001493 [Schleiferilactobacillus perolens DSM 12744]